MEEGTIIEKLKILEPNSRFFNFAKSMFISGKLQEQSCRNSYIINCLNNKNEPGFDSYQMKNNTIHKDINKENNLYTNREGDTKIRRQIDREKEDIEKDRTTKTYDKRERDKRTDR